METKPANGGQGKTPAAASPEQKKAVRRKKAPESVSPEQKKPVTQKKSSAGTITKQKKEYKYKAFISYRHTEFDKKTAEKLQRLLETYKLPGGGKTGWRLFRDETELPTSSDLGQDIENALRESEFLICVCSPDYLTSRWCAAEIDYFKKIHRGSVRRIIPLLISGRPEESFPASITRDDLLHQEVEPLAANIVAGSQKESLKKLNVEFLRIAAPMLNCGFDDLYRREEKRARKRRLIAGSAAGAVLAVIAGLSVSYAVSMSRKNEQITAQNARIESQNEKLLRENSETLCAESEMLYAGGSYIEAIRTAVKALPSSRGDKPVLPKAENLLARETNAFQKSSFVPACELVHETAVQEMICTNGGANAITRDSRYIYFWDTQTGEALKKYSLSDLGYDSFVYNVLIYDSDTVIEEAGIDSGGFYIYDAVPGLGTEVIGKSRKQIKETQTSPDRIFIKSESGDLWRISETTGELLWECPIPERNYCKDVIYGKDGLFRICHRSQDLSTEELYAEQIDPETGEIIDSVLVDSEDISVWRDYSFYNDGDILTYHLPINPEKITVLKNKNGSFTEINKIDLGDINAAFAFSVKKTGEYYYVYSGVDIDTTNKMLITKYDSSFKKALWTTAVKGRKFEDCRVFRIDAEKADNYTDLIVTESGGYVSVIDEKTGDVIKEFAFPNGVSSAYAAENGGLFVLSGNGEYAVNLSGLKYSGEHRNALTDDDSCVVFQFKTFETRLDISGHSGDTYVTAGSGSSTAYVYRVQNNPDYRAFDIKKLFPDYDFNSAYYNEVKIDPEHRYLFIGLSGIQDALAVYDLAREQFITTGYELNHRADHVEFLENDTLFMLLSEKDDDGRTKCFFCLTDLKTGKTARTELDGTIFGSDIIRGSEGEGILIKDSDPKKVTLVHSYGDIEKIAVPDENESGLRIMKECFAAGPGLTEIAAPMTVPKNSDNDDDSGNDGHYINIQTSYDREYQLTAYNFLDRSFTVIDASEIGVTFDQADYSANTNIQSMFYHDRGRLIVITTEGQIGCFDTSSGKLVWKADTHGINTAVTSAANIDGEHYLIIGDDQNLYRMNNHGFDGRKTALTFSPDYVKEYVHGSNNGNFSTWVTGDSKTLVLTADACNTGWLIDLDSFETRYSIGLTFNSYSPAAGEIFCADLSDLTAGFYPVYTTEQLIKRAEDYLSHFRSDTE